MTSFDICYRRPSVSLDYDVVSAGSFVLDGEQRAVVYHRAVTQSELAVGDHVRVVGQPIDDWMRMDGVEINADTVEPISP